MINTDQRLTTANTVNDNSTDSSDLLSMLKAVEQLYAATRIVISSHSAAAILVSLAVEVQTLLTKLRAMRQRWTVHLPFKEASTVDFVNWSNWARQLSVVIGTTDSRFCLAPGSSTPSCHCLLDLYYKATQASAETSDTDDLSDPKQLLHHHAEMQEELTTRREQCVDAISRLISSHFTDSQLLDITRFDDLAAARSACSTLLQELSEELYLLHEQLVKYFTAKDYVRLADRILYEPEYDGQTARREARDTMYNWRNGVPLGKLEESRKKQIELTKQAIRRTRHGVKLEEYVNLDDDIPSQRSGFGQFLFNRRRDITRVELRELIYLVYCVYYYQYDALQEAGRSASQTALPDADAPESWPKLPPDFLQQLRDSRVAVNSFFRILRRVEPYINNSGASVPGSTPELCKHYKDWGWYHLQTAFEQLKFLPKNSNKASFTTFIHTQFPHRKESGVNRDLYRNGNVNDPNIVADVVKEFQPVLSLIKSSSSSSVTTNP